MVVDGLTRSAYAAVVAATANTYLVPFLCLLGIGAAFAWRRIAGEQQDREFRRTYPASRAAVQNALRGVLAELNYWVKADDPDTGDVRFKSGLPGMWLGGWGGAEGTASVRQGDARTAELVISVRLTPRERPVWGSRRASLAWGYWNDGYPETRARRAKRIFDRVQATVVTYEMIESAASPRGSESA